MPINAERVKEAPAQALRAVFAGIGQLLLTADKMRKRGAAPDSAVPADDPSRAAEPAPGSDSEPAAGARRSLDQTGNVRLLTAEDLPEAPAAEPEAAAPETAETAERAEAAATEAAALEVEAAELEAAELEAEADLVVTEAEAQGDVVIVTEPEADLVAVTEPEAEPEADLVVVAEIEREAEMVIVTDTEPEAGLPVPNYDALSLPSLRARLRSLDAAQLGVLVEYERAHAGRADVLAMFERRMAKLAAGG